ncbi:hypothetical protein P2H44_04545 [Albimonas sp. CAU 1670]|uniref:hypothetical protein n=1 Tax=Albimonas sp. CAU 1670 TaxID=3032599 RepID=UPI0023D9E01E|nr:hypothetical protein [Albimonas sp. CAU 1670]MDF2231814.1 hypothetical protein [Albimonas sp. CAU 1670]
MPTSSIWSGRSGNAYVTVCYEVGERAPALPAVCVATARGPGGRRRAVAVRALDDAAAALAPGGELRALGASEAHLWFDVGPAPMRAEIAADIAAALGPVAPGHAPAAGGRAAGGRRAAS